MAAAGLALAFSSCTAVQMTSDVAPVGTAVFNLTVADLNVSKQKAEHTVSWEWNPFMPVSIEAKKQTATAELLRQVGADVLVEPQYIVKHNGFLQGGSVLVSGYPATYSGFRAMTDQDAEKIALVNGEGCKVAPVKTSSSILPKKKK